MSRRKRVFSGGLSKIAKDLWWSDADDPSSLPVPRGMIPIVLGFLILIWAYVAVVVFQTQIGTVYLDSSVASLDILDCYVEKTCDSTFSFKTFYATVKVANQTMTIDGSGSLRCSINLCILPRNGSLTVKVANSVLNLMEPESSKSPATFPLSVATWLDFPASNNKIFLDGLASKAVFVNLTQGILVMNRMRSPTIRAINGFGPIIVQEDYTASFSVSARTWNGGWCASPKVTYAAPPCLAASGVAACSFSASASNVSWSGPTIQYSLEASSVYIQDYKYGINQTTFKYTELRNGGSLMQTVPSLLPSVVSALADTFTFSQSSSMEDYVQAVEIVTPSIGTLFLNARKRITMEIGPEWLAFLSAYALRVNYRKLTTPLSHYRCENEVGVIPTRSGSLINFHIDRSFSYSQYRAEDFGTMLRSYVGLEDQFTLGALIHNLTSLDTARKAVTVFTSPEQEYTNPKDLLGNRWRFYQIARAPEGFLYISELQVGSVSYALIILSVLSALSLCLAIYTILFSQRHAILTSVMLKQSRELLRNSVDADTPCPYHYYLSVLQLTSWIVFRTQLYLMGYYYSAVRSTFSTFLYYYFKEAKDDGVLEAKAAKVTIEQLQLMYSRFCMLRYLRNETSTEDMDNALDQFGARRFVDSKLVMVGVRSRKKVTSSTFTLQYASLQSYYLITGNPRDEALFDDLVNRCALAGNHIETDALIKKLTQWKIPVIKRPLDIAGNIIPRAVGELNEERLAPLVEKWETNVSAFPSFAQVNWYSTGSERKFRRVITTFLWLAFEAFANFVAAFILFVVVYLFTFPLEIEHARFSSSTSIILRNEVTLAATDTTSPRPQNLLSSTIFAATIVYTVAMLFDPILVLLTYRFVGQWTPRRALHPKFFLLYIRWFGTALTFFMLFVILTYSFSFILMVLVWWVLGAIIAPNRMLVYCASVITFIYTIIATYMNLNSMRKAAIHRIQERILEALLKILRKTPAVNLFDSAQAASNAPFGALVSHAAIGPQVTSGLVLDVISDDIDVRDRAIAQLSSALQTPQAIIILGLALVRREQSLTGRAVREVLAELKVPEQFVPLAQQLVYQLLNLPSSAAELSHALYKLPSDAVLEGRLLEYDEVIVPLVQCAISRRYDKKVLIEAVARITLDELADVLSLDAILLRHGFSLGWAFYEQNVQKSLTETAFLMEKFQTQIPKDPKPLGPLYNVILQTVKLGCGQPNQLQGALVDSVKKLGLHGSPIVTAMLPVLEQQHLGDARAADIHFGKLWKDAIHALGPAAEGGGIETASLASSAKMSAKGTEASALRYGVPPAVTKVLEVGGNISRAFVMIAGAYAGMTDEQLENFRLLLDCLACDHIALRKLPSCFRPTSGNILKEAFDDWYDDMQVVNGLGTSKDPKSMADAKEKLQNKIKDARSNSDDAPRLWLGAWLAEQWGAIDDLLSLRRVRRGKYCDLRALAEYVGIPLGGLLLLETATGAVQDFLDFLFFHHTERIRRAFAEGRQVEELVQEEKEKLKKEQQAAADAAKKAATADFSDNEGNEAQAVDGEGNPIEEQPPLEPDVPHLSTVAFFQIVGELLRVLLHDTAFAVVRQNDLSYRFKTGILLDRFAIEGLKKEAGAISKQLNAAKQRTISTSARMKVKDQILSKQVTLLKAHAEQFGTFTGLAEITDPMVGVAEGKEDNRDRDFSVDLRENFVLMTMAIAIRGGANPEEVSGYAKQLAFACLRTKAIDEDDIPLLKVRGAVAGLADIVDMFSDSPKDTQSLARGFDCDERVLVALSRPAEALSNFPELKPLEPALRLLRRSWKGVGWNTSGVSTLKDAEMGILLPFLGVASYALAEAKQRFRFWTVSGARDKWKDPEPEPAAEPSAQDEGTPRAEVEGEGEGEAAEGVAADSPHSFDKTEEDAHSKGDAEAADDAGEQQGEAADPETEGAEHADEDDDENDEENDGDEDDDDYWDENDDDDDGDGDGGNGNTYSYEDWTANNFEYLRDTFIDAVRKREGECHISVIGLLHIHHEKESRAKGNSLLDPPLTFGSAPGGASTPVPESPAISNNASLSSAGAAPRIFFSEILEVCFHGQALKRYIEHLHKEVARRQRRRKRRQRAEAGLAGGDLSAEGSEGDASAKGEGKDGKDTAAEETPLPIDATGTEEDAAFLKRASDEVMSLMTIFCPNLRRRVHLALSSESHQHEVVPMVSDPHLQKLDDLLTFFAEIPTVSFWYGEYSFGDDWSLLEADLPFRHLTPFFFLGRKESTKQGRRNAKRRRELFGILSGVPQWFPKDQESRLCALACAAVWGSSTPPNVLDLLAEALPLRHRKAGLEVMRLATGRAEGSTIALCEVFKMDIQRFRSIRDCFIPPAPIEIVDSILSMTLPGEQVIDRKTGQLRPVDKDDEKHRAPHRAYSQRWLGVLNEFIKGNPFALLSLPELHDELKLMSSLVNTIPWVNYSVGSRVLNPACGGEFLEQNYAGYTDKEASAVTFPTLNSVLDSLLPSNGWISGDLFLGQGFGATMNIEKAFPYGGADLPGDQKFFLILRRLLDVGLGALFIATSDFEAAKARFQSFASGSNVLLALCEIGVLCIRNILEEGAVNDPGAILRTVQALVTAIPELLPLERLKALKLPHEAHLIKLIEIIVPFIPRHLESLTWSVQEPSAIEVTKQKDDDNRSNEEDDADSVAAEPTQETLDEEQVNSFVVVFQKIEPELSALKTKLNALTGATVLAPLKEIVGTTKVVSQALPVVEVVVNGQKEAKAEEFLPLRSRVIRGLVEEMSRLTVPNPAGRTDVERRGILLGLSELLPKLKGSQLSPPVITKLTDSFSTLRSSLKQVQENVQSLPDFTLISIIVEKLKKVCDGSMLEPLKSVSNPLASSGSVNFSVDGETTAILTNLQGCAAWLEWALPRVREFLEATDCSSILESWQPAEPLESYELDPPSEPIPTETDAKQFFKDYFHLKKFVESVETHLNEAVGYTTELQSVREGPILKRMGEKATIKAIRRLNDLVESGAIPTIGKLAAELPLLCSMKDTVSQIQQLSSDPFLETFLSRFADTQETLRQVLGAILLMIVPKEKEALAERCSDLVKTFIYCASETAERPSLLQALDGAKRVFEAVIVLRKEQLEQHKILMAQKEKALAEIAAAKGATTVELPPHIAALTVPESKGVQDIQVSVEELAEVRDMAERLHTVVSAVVKENEVIGGPQLFLEFLKEVVKPRRFAIQAARAGGSDARTLVPMTAQDQRKINLLIQVIQGDLDVLGELINSTGITIPPAKLEQLMTVLRLMQTLRRIVQKKDLSNITVTDTIDIITQQIFNEFDIEKSGKISFDAFLAALSRLRLNLSTQEGKLLFSLADTDQSGYITIDEFRGVIGHVRKRFQLQLIDQMNLSRESIYLTLTFTALFVIFLLCFIVLGVYAFSDGTQFTSVITAAIPLAGTIFNTLKDPNAIHLLLQTCDEKVSQFFDAVLEI